MASAAEPLHASTLWTSYSLKREKADVAGLPPKRRRVGTTLANIDNALSGGLDYGQISCISSPPEARASDLVLAILASHLLSDPDATATVIDSTLAFDIRRLYGILVRRVQTQGHDVAGVMKALDRLKIMKVFDFTGMTEAVSEVRDELEDGRRRPQARTDAAPSVQLSPKGTISDSEGEEEETLEIETPPQASARLATEHELTRARSTMLVINSISQLTIPLLKSNHSQAQSLLTSTLHSIGHLTIAHDLCTLLINGTQLWGASNQAKEDSPSIFSTCTLRPALGQNLGHLFDLHLLVHEVPRTAESARTVYGGGAVPIGGRRVELGNVVEVLQDRYGGRVGRWSGFTSASDGRLLTCM
ncbi:hypothetical protein Tdes44962_MAKER08010 [Teratosphaeria destructans]|uniref:Uncharacterized protein n=1 Tax=Teratosphaeria destructans TaxID=418781 RepID=A0A9W7SY74_9PEZI|nr:hypothetical protein Tdes44962_MAKER08010 [Teratosphaeria destructans]